MNKRRTEIKVGIFVVIGLVLGALLILQFNKSAGPLTPTYTLQLKAADVAGVIPGSFVLMAGVRIGSVEKIELNTTTGEVAIYCKLLRKYELKKDAFFSIRQSGFLGDQYIGVIQGKSAEILTGNEPPIPCEAPIDLGEVAKSSGGLIKRVDSMVVQLSNAVHRVDTTLLDGGTLTNIAVTISNLRGVSERTLATLSKVESLIDTNAGSINQTMTNFQSFSLKLNGLAEDLRETIATNKGVLASSMSNIQSATLKLDKVMTGVDEGKGLAGTLLKSDELATNVSLIVSNLQVLSSNINNKGLWGVFRKPKVPSKK